MSILWVSNGYGEDAIASTLATAYSNRYPDQTMVALPLIGDGHHYQAARLSPVLQLPMPPSGGFIRSVRTAWTDIRCGLLRTIRHQFRAARQWSRFADTIIAVGDIYCLVVASQFSARPVVFLPTAKSDLFMPHSAIERIIMRRRCRLILPRDDRTAIALRRHSLPAHYVGNPMMHVHPLTTLSTSRMAAITIGILPGSRDEAYTNFALIIRLISSLPSSVRLLVCTPPQLSQERLQEIAKPITIPIDWTTQMNELITYSSVVIGLAGTANEQAAYYGRTVLCFEGTGPQSTHQRFAEQHTLMGDRIQIIDAHPDSLYAAITPFMHPPTPVDWQSSDAIEAIIKMIH